MTAAVLVICSYALVALLFCGAGVVVAREPVSLAPRWMLLAALGAGALWALAIAGIGERDVVVLVAACARNLAWLLVLWHIARGRHAVAARDGAYAATAMCMVLAWTLAAVHAGSHGSAAGPLASTSLALRMLASAAALVLAYRAQGDADAPDGGGRQLLIGSLSLMWSADMLAFLAAYVAGDWPVTLTLARGIATAATPVLVAIAMQRNGAWTLRLSRSVALRALMLAAATLYVAATLTVTGVLAGIGGDHARLFQAAFVFGTAAAVLALASTPWLRAWTKVSVAKHLFSHRYDYRVEWMRFTDTLAAAAGHGAPLVERVVKGIADLTDSPGGLLLLADAQGLRAAAGWRWAGGAPATDDVALAGHLEASCRIVDLDAVRAGRAPEGECAAVPAWLLGDDAAWAIVPLIHGGRLTGAIVLARPPVDRALDWEDFDLLGAVGRQAASYLAENRLHAALAEARRFEEFNRRFAFIMHDLKNLVSQIALVARNAERHADNPAFRADMIATLQDCSQRMSTLLQRLSQHAAPEPLRLRAVALDALAERIADARRTQHRVCTGGARAIAMADPAALETALDHLIQNAVDASAPDAPISLVAEDAGDGGVALSVVDAGRGMSADFVRDELFRPFSSLKPGGFGLGAFEARQLVEGMGGRIEVTSREGDGTRFRIVLPAAPALESAA